eukprot:g8887.t1
MRKVASPFTFLLWCLGLDRWRHQNANNLLRWRNHGSPLPPLTRGWLGALRRRGHREGERGEGGGALEFLELQQGGEAGSSTARVATLGERGRRSAFDQFQQLRRDGACCDVTLAVGGRMFKAHKCVLAAQSSPLRAMFEGSFKEGSEDLISLVDVEPSSFSLLLDFFYGRSVEVVDENVEALLELSARYGVSLLRRHCCAFMAGSANPNNACSLLAVADRYDCHRLRTELLAFLLECFPLACCGASDGFRHLSPALAAEVLKDDRLAAGEQGEVAVFWAAVSWLEAELSRRRKADEILSHVRFGLVSAETLADAVEAHPLMQSKAGKAFVHEAYRYQALPPESRAGFASSMAARARPRVPVGSDGGDAFSSSSAAAAAADAAAVRPNQPGSSSGGLRAIGTFDEEASSSCEEGGSDPDTEPEEKGFGGSLEGSESEGRGDEDAPRAAPAPTSGAAVALAVAVPDEMSQGEEAQGGESSGDLSMDTDMAMACTALVGVGTVLLALMYIVQSILGTTGRITMQGKHCLVTGGSSGIGKEVAKQLVREGAHVTIVARRQGVLDAAMLEVEACRVLPGQMMQTISVDVGDAAAVEKAMVEAVARQGAVHVLANCAGFAIAKEFDEMEMADFERLLRVNTLGSAYVTRALLPGMKAAGGGRVLFTSSMAGQSGSYGYTAYSASKFALVGMAQSLQMEVKAYGIGVAVAYPPDTDTPGFQTENVGKPEVTRLIGEDAGGVFSPTQVAATIVKGLKAGDFCITFGAEGFLVGLGTAGFAPCFSVTQALCQVLAAARGSGYRGGGGGGPRAAGKDNPPRYGEDETGRASSSNQRGGGSARALGGPCANGNATHRDDHLEENDGSNNVGEVDYTDGEMGSASSSFVSSPHSSAGSGGGRRGPTSGAGGGGGGGGSRKGSNQTMVRNKKESRGASFSPSHNGVTTTSGVGLSNGGGSSGGMSDGVQPIPGVSARPAGVPFGASALSKTMPHTGRGRPRGLRPRSSGAGTPGSANSQVHRVPLFSAAGRQGSSSGGAGGAGYGSGTAAAGGNALARRGTPSATFREAEARAAELLAPGVPVDVAVRAAIKIESVMRVLIARGYVRRKLVSEVTAFSLIMERGIDVIKHPFSGKSKPKNVTVNFVSRKGAMQLSWGGKSGVPLETIFGVTKGINTDALRNAVDPERADNCFSLHTHERTIDFEVDNPWLVLLVVRALRLFLGAHYDTLPAPTFFSHLCLRPRSGPPGSVSSSSHRADSPKQTMVWTSADKQLAAGKEQTTRSTPTERTSGDSASDESGGGRGNNNRRQSPWDGADGDSDAGSTLHEVAAMESTRYPPAPDGRAPGAGETAPPPPPDAPEAPDAPSADERAADFVGDIHSEGGENDETSGDRSPGGVMALFSSGRRGPEEIGVGGFGGGQAAIPRSGTSGSEGLASSGGAPAEGVPAAAGEEAPLTASQLLATRGMTKRLNLSKKLSAASKENGPLKGKRFDLMALPMDPGQQDRRERGASEHAETTPKRTQGMSISIGAGYDLPEEKNRVRSREEEGGGQEVERIAVVDDLNDKLQSLRKLCVPQARPGSYRPGRAPKTMAVKHMAFFQGGSGSVKSGAGLGSVADMWGDGVRRQYHTDMVRQKDQSVEDVHKRDSVRTAMLVNRSGVHRVTRKAVPPESR